MQKLDMESKNIIDSNMEKLKELFPSCVQEGKINFDKLKQELSTIIIDDKKEKYQLTWPGKKEAIVNANTPSKNTLRPIKEKSVDFDKTKNIYIEGDNLEALKIIQESYLNKIKCIYIDPPYNTGSDFIYNDNFNKSKNEELVESGQIDENRNRMITNNQSNGRFHSDWMSMMYPRLKLARNLLKKDGVIFISIDENEYSNLKKICDEIFGESCYITSFIWQKRTGGGFSNTLISVNHEYVLMYCKSDNVKIVDIVKSDEDVNRIYNYQDENGKYKRRDLRKSGTADRRIDRPTMYYGIKAPDGSEIFPKKANGEDGRWTYSQDKFNSELLSNNIDFVQVNGEWKIYYKERYNEQTGKSQKHESLLTNLVSNTQGTKEIEELFGDKNYFSFPKPTQLIEYLIKMIIDDNDIVMDFFSGSGTTAQSVMQINSEENKNIRYILIQLPELCAEKSEAYRNGFKNLCQLAQERIKRAYEKKIKQLSTKKDHGFRVYKVDSSNMKDVYYKPSELGQTNLLDLMSNIKEDRTPEDLLTQVVLDLGLTLDLKIKEKKIINNNVYYVEDNALVACFDDNVDITIVDEICKCKPLKVVFKDASFKSDKDKINLRERIKKLSTDTEISIL